MGRRYRPAAARCYRRGRVGLVAERYRIEELVGEGGSSRVYRALDTRAGSAMGNYVVLYETEDGEVSIRHDGSELSARAFDKQGHVRQGAIVDHKLLDIAEAPSRLQRP